MSLKVIIAGGRDFNDFTLMRTKCKRILSNYEDIEIVSGKAKGADTLGEKFALLCGYPVKEFAANWDLFGKAAGHIRNSEMADYANVLIAFWDGESRGTADMIKCAKQVGLVIRIIRY